MWKPFQQQHLSRIQPLHSKGDWLTLHSSISQKQSAHFKVIRLHLSMIYNLINMNPRKPNISTLSWSIKYYDAPNTATNEPIISYLSGLFLSTILPHTIEEIIKIPP